MTLQLISETLALSAIAAGAIGYGARILPDFIGPHEKNACAATVADCLPDALLLQETFGYNLHSLVSLQSEALFWKDRRTNGAIIYQDYGFVWLASCEPLCSDEDTADLAERFRQEARSKNRLVAFVPTSEKFAEHCADSDFSAVKIGASPYFDLQKWNPCGDKAKNMRSSINQAKREGIRVEAFAGADCEIRLEIKSLCRKWLYARRSQTEFGWLFRLAPFLYEDRKRYFAARTANGNLVGLLAASPIPARNGWYLEDVLRFPDAPYGTADILVREALQFCREEGAELATLGSVPLSRKGTDKFGNNKHFFSEKLMNTLPQNLKRFYNFQGLEKFKAKFVPTFWESEYLLTSDHLLVPPLVANAVLRAVLPHGILNFAKRQILVNRFKD